MSADSTRDRILQAAGPIFADRGFKDATVREICDAAQVNLAAVNYYFGDKEQLYIHAVALARQTRVDQAPLPDWPPGIPTATKLHDFIHTIMTRLLVLQEAPWQVRLMMREVIQPTAACKTLVQEYFRPQFELLMSVLDEQLPATVPLHRRQQLGFSIIGQCFFYRAAGQVVGLVVGEEDLAKHYNAQQLADHVLATTLAAIGLAPPLGAGSPAPTPSTGSLDEFH